MATHIKKLTPAFATHPGEVIQDELEARKINQKDFAIELGVSPTQLNELIKGKRNISAEFALKLEAVLKIDSKYWLQLQSNYDLDKAKIKATLSEEHARIERWQILKEYVPILFLRKQKILIGDVKEDENTIKKIYNSASIDDIIHQVSLSYDIRFKKSSKLSTNVINIVGLVKLVEYKSKSIDVPNFKPEKSNDLINELKTIFLGENIIDKTEKVLSKNGIKFVIQEKPDQVPVDGLSLWKDNNPIIGLTLRHKRLDNFVFTLLHELGHVYLHLNKDKNRNREFVDDIEDIKFIKENAEESEADSFARNNLFEELIWDDFIFRHRDFDEQSISDFSKNNNLDPAVVRGRLLHDGFARYNSRSPFKNEIR